jgi:hypothetical protein
MNKALVCSLLLFWGASAHTEAQAQNGPMRGLEGVLLSMRPASASGDAIEPCDISVRQLESISIVEIDNSRLKLIDNGSIKSNEGVVIIEVDALCVCVSLVRLRLHTVTCLDCPSPNLIYLYGTKALSMGTPNDVGAGARQQVEDVVREMLSAWIRDNPR